MGVMKKFLLFGMILGILVSLPVRASVTVEESTDPEYMINSGFSQLTAEQVFIEKNRVTGKPIEPLYEKSNNIFVKAFRSLYSYLDSAIDSDERIHHDIKASPSYTDL